jgi:hypothetical protein
VKEQVKKTETGQAVGYKHCRRMGYPRRKIETQSKRRDE